ncbi:MAG: hypothetical protein JWN04_6534 [Myxococcaceae bacterium]|nr:hypothetical protein [Myxococcaceae bacterium]
MMSRLVGSTRARRCRRAPLHGLAIRRTRASSGRGKAPLAIIAIQMSRSAARQAGPLVESASRVNWMSQ